jgi:hypothetical protein
MRDNVPSRFIVEAFLDRGQILLGHRLVVEGSRIEERAKGILTLESKVLKEAFSRYQLVIWELVDKSMEMLAFFHDFILHDASQAGEAPAAEK